MDFAALAQYLFNGLFSASVYALIALGLTLIFGVLRVGDLAQGALYAVGAYAVWVLTGWGVEYAIAVPVALTFCAALSVFNGRVVYRRLLTSGIGPTFIGAVALLVIYRNLLALAFGWDPKQVVSPFGLEALRLGLITVETHKLWVIAFAALAVLGLWLFLYHARWGGALRALAQNEEVALTLGINARHVSLVAFALAGALAGGAGALLAPLWPFDPVSGTLFVLKAFAIAVVARTKVSRVVLVSAIVGVGEVLIQAYWRAEFSDLFPFLLLAGVLLFQPQALSPEAETTPRFKPVRVATRLGNWRGWMPLLLLLAVTLPWWIQDNFWLHLFILSGIYVLLVSGLDLLSGHAGIPSLAQAGLWGVGAYASALLAMRWHWAFPATLLGAMAAAVIVAWGIGALGLRLRGRWSSFTFIIGVVLTLLLESLTDLTGGTHGLSGVPPIVLTFPGLGSLVLNPFRNKVAFFYLVLAFVGMALWLKRRIVRSRMGRALEAIREDEGLARAIGIASDRYKLNTFLISAGFAGAAGSLYAHYVAYLHPQLFTFSQSFQLFVMNMVGGAGSVLGPVLGPIILVLFGEMTRSLHATLAEIVFSVLLLVVLVYLPEGLSGAWRRLRSPRRIAAANHLEPEEALP